MLKFKQFINPKEFLGFSNAGGPEGQYDKFNFTGNMVYGQGGGPEVKEEIYFDENLNPRKNPEVINSGSRILFDPEKNNEGLGDEQHEPENIGIPDYHGTGYVHPRYTREQAKNAAILAQQTERNNRNSYDYFDYIPKYTSNSYNLNNTLWHHHIFGGEHPEEIEANDEEDSIIHVPSFDNLINHHRLPHEMTIYSGLHFHPNDHRGKIVVVPSYMSTSLSPHVAKDFGKPFSRSFDDDTPNIKNILRLHLPKNHPALFADNASLFPGQGELILPRNMRYQLGQKPTHIIRGKFYNHFNPDRTPDYKEYHFYTGRVLPKK